MHRVLKSTVKCKPFSAGRICSWKPSLKKKSKKGLFFVKVRSRFSLYSFLDICKLKTHYGSVTSVPHLFACRFSTTTEPFLCFFFFSLFFPTYILFVGESLYFISAYSITNTEHRNLFFLQKRLINTRSWCTQPFIVY